MSSTNNLASCYSGLNNNSVNLLGSYSRLPVIANSNGNIKKQLFSLNSLSTDELRLKWLELYKFNPTNLKRGYLIKGLAYRIQFLAGCTNVSEEELSLSMKIAKERIGLASFNSSSLSKTKQVNLIPPAGSVIKSFYKNKEYLVKVLVNDLNNKSENRFEYEGKIYRSLSAIATEITGTRWNGYTFFKLKKTVKK